jgi:D-alanine-D-alanine ligase
MIKKILILAGGYSKERLISLQTAKGVFQALKKKKYNAIVSEPNGNLVNILKKFKPDVVFNALHGRYGEDGYIQAILEIKKLKYTHSGVIASSIAMDKEISKKIFLKNKILTPKYIKYKFKEKKIKKNQLISKIQKKFDFPIIIKPINEGSSVHVYICTKKNLIKNISKMKLYREILIEQFIPGREIQVAILGNNKLGAIELKPKRKFYDYKAKYSVKAKTKHIIPVDLSKTNLEKVMNIALKAHKLIGCRGVTRSDFKYDKGKFYLLEINTQPGMTKLSLVPEIAAYSGMSFINLIEWIIKDASINR